jgi:hypothetical protein
MAGLTDFYCGWNEPSHASQFKWLEYTFNEQKKELRSRSYPTTQSIEFLKREKSNSSKF